MERLRLRPDFPPSKFLKAACNPRSFFYFHPAVKTIRLEDLHYAGFIVKPTGFNGELILAAETVEPEELEALDFMFLSIDGLPVPFRVTGFRIKSGNVVLKFKDVDSEEAAKSLNGIEVYLEELPVGESASDPSFSDLEGFMVVDAAAGPIGPILEVEELPMQYIARCEYRQKEVLIPLNEAIVTGIDPENRTVEVRLPDGLLDVYLGEDEAGEEEG